MAAEHDERKCPLAAVDRRLEDLHRQWHQAEAAYFDPEGFRAAIQTAIQTLRTVTFILQNHKHIIPDFDRWYGEWQEKFRGDPLMVWMREARNRIEKQGDLEARSFVRAEIIASYLNEGASVQVPAKLWEAPLQLVKSIPHGALGTHVRKDGVVRIQRRWIESSLPNHELLDAVAIAYGCLAELVAAAHVQLGLKPPITVHEPTGAPYPEGARDGRMPCMIGHEDARTLDVWLATGVPVEFETVEKVVSIKELREASKRYEIAPSEIYGAGDRAIDRLRGLFATARKMFEADGHHIMIAFLLREGKPVHFLQLRPGEHGHKYLMMRNLARDVVNFGADAVILTSESWAAPADPAKPYMRAVDSPNRREFLSSTLATKAGEPVLLSAEILREGDTVKLGATREEAAGAQFQFAPIYEAWGREIPPEWMKLSTRADGDEAS